MAHLIIGKDNQTGKYAAISDDWLTRFPGEYEFVRDALDPITEEELEAQQADSEALAKAREAEIKAGAKTVAKAEAAAAAAAAAAGTNDSGAPRERF